MKHTRKVSNIVRRSIAILLLCAMTIVSVVSVDFASSYASKKMALNYSAKTLKAGKSLQLKVGNLPVGAKKVTYTWTSSKKSVAKVSAKGKVTALKAGKSTIKCTVKYQVKQKVNGKKKYVKKTAVLKCTINVKSSSSVSSTTAPTTEVKPVTTAEVVATATPESTTDSQATPTANTGNQATPTVAPTANTGNQATPTVAPTANTDSQATPTVAPTANTGNQATPTPTPTVAPADFSDTAIEFASKLGAGINVGNTLDSYTTVEYLAENGYAASDMTNLYMSGSAGLDVESSWGNPKVTKSLIHAIKEAGFKTIRIPVTYVNHTIISTDSSGNKVYTIDAEWLARVKQVVDYGIDEGLYVIINVHSDGVDTYDNNGTESNMTDDTLIEYGGEQSSWLNPLNNSETAYSVMENRFASLWTQIANEFKDYNEYLIYADMNEFRHGYNTPEQVWYDTQNKLHQVFVDTVRSTGGNNPSRYLIVPGYNTNIEYTIAGLQVPTDIDANNTTVSGNTAGHIMVEVHYYTPYTYAGDGAQKTEWGSGADPEQAETAWGTESDVIDQMGKMKSNFVDKGIPVILGEFGAPTHSGTTAENDLAYRTYYYSYVSREAAKDGIVPIVWDNDSGNAYGLFDRTTNEKVFSSIIDSVINYQANPDTTIVAPWEN